MEDRPNRLGMIWNQLGIILSHLNDIPESKECFERALQIKRSYLAEDDPALATLYNNLGAIHKEEEIRQRALKIHLKNPQTCRAEITAEYSNIAAIYIDQGKLNQAFLYQQRALEINLKYLPANHPDIAQSYYYK